MTYNISPLGTSHEGTASRVLKNMLSHKSISNAYSFLVFLAKEHIFMFYVLEINELDDPVENNSPTRTCSSTDCIRKSTEKIRKVEREEVYWKMRSLHKVK